MELSLQSVVVLLLHLAESGLWRVRGAHVDQSAQRPAPGRQVRWVCPVVIHCTLQGQLALSSVEVMSLELGYGLCCIAGASRVVGHPHLPHKRM